MCLELKKFALQLWLGSEYNIDYFCCYIIKCSNAKTYLIINIFTLKTFCTYSWADATVNMNYITGAVDQECAADLMARVAINR